MKQETVSGSGISWAICKSASCSRQITTPAPHHSVFFTGRMPFLPPNQQCQSTEGKALKAYNIHKQTIYIEPKSKIESTVHYASRLTRGQTGKKASAAHKIGGGGTEIIHYSIADLNKEHGKVSKQT